MKANLYSEQSPDLNRKTSHEFRLLQLFYMVGYIGSGTRKYRAHARNCGKISGASVTIIARKRHSPNLRSTARDPVQCPDPRQSQSPAGDPWPHTLVPHG